MDRRLVPAGIGDDTPALVRHDHRGDPSEILHGPRVTLNEVDAALGEGGLGAGVGRGAEDRDQELHRDQW